MRKRQKLVLSAIVLTLGLLLIQLATLELRYVLIGLMGGLAWVLAAWALREGLSGIEWLTVTLPSVTFTVSVGLFYILLPESWWTRVAIAVGFGVGEYALLLTANIFSVAAIRTIALLRAASAVGFVLTLVTGFFLFDTIFSFRMPFWATGSLVAGTALLLVLPAYWSVELEPKLSRRVVSLTIWSAVGVGVLAAAICFWPISIAVASLFSATSLYVFLGIIQHHLAQRLFSRTLWEYLTVGLAVTVTMLLTAGWGV